MPDFFHAKNFRLKKSTWSIGISLIVVLFFVTCVNEFDPVDYYNIDPLIVIDGHVLKEDSIQQVAISTSIKLNEHDFNGISGCYVIVNDKEENTFVFRENDSKPGVYQCAIPKEYLYTGNAFELYVQTPNGNEYLSSYDTILPKGEIDSFYYRIEQYNTPESVEERGLHFYTDLTAINTNAKYFMWEVVESWEYRAKYEIDGHWVIGNLSMPLYDHVDTLVVCYATNTVAETFTQTTDNLVVNEKKQIPLHYRDIFDKKLHIRYSALLKQYSLTKNAYDFHSNSYAANGSDINLYESQPKQQKSNVININNPNENVLGYFWASSYTAKRVFVNGPFAYADTNTCPVFEIEYKAFPDPDDPPPRMTLLDYFKSLEKNVYLIALEFIDGDNGIVNQWGFPDDQSCMDCRLGEGTNKKPEFWE